MEQQIGTQSEVDERGPGPCGCFGLSGQRNLVELLERIARCTSTIGRQHGQMAGLVEQIAGPGQGVAIGEELAVAHAQTGQERVAAKGLLVHGKADAAQECNQRRGRIRIGHRNLPSPAPALPMFRRSMVPMMQGERGSYGSGQ